MKTIDRVLPIMFAVAIAIGLVLLAFLINNFGYKDGYCSALNGKVIGDSRFCNVDNRVVEIPKP